MAMAAKTNSRQQNQKTAKEPQMKKRLLLRMILAYFLFVIVGFIGTTQLAARNDQPLMDVTATFADIRDYFLTGYYKNLFHRLPGGADPSFCLHPDNPPPVKADAPLRRRLRGGRV